MMVWVAVGVLLGVSLGAFAAQRLLAGRIHAKVASKLAAPRKLQTPASGRARLVIAGGLTLTLISPRDDSQKQQGPTQAEVVQVNGQDIKAFDWLVEKTFWERRAKRIRHTFLDRTQETAEKWRTVFTGLLAVFGAVLVINQPNPSDTGIGGFIKIALIFALAFALHAVAYTGWASAGLPKMLIDVNAETAFEADTREGCYSLARLRVGITCGALTALALTLAFAASLA